MSSSMNNDALVMVHLRNQFYRQKYHMAVGVFLLCLILISLLIGMLVYVVKHPPRPLYFATDDAGRFLLDIPLTQPNMTTDDVMAWVVEAVEAAYSYDYKNYRAQLQNAQKYFIDYGWRSYMKGLHASNNLLALTDRKQVVIAKVLPTPKLIAEGPLGKAATYAWKFQMEMLVTYLKPPLYDEKTKTENPLIITVLVERQNLLSSYKGLGIVQLIGTLAQANGS
jgi:intracellular multiplication protein IcmL